MKIFHLALFVSGLQFCSYSFAKSGNEEKTEAWIDSAFVANNVDWDQTKTEFLLFSKTNFKNANSIPDFLLALVESTSPKREKSGLITTTFPLLTSFSKTGYELMEGLKQQIITAIEAEGEWCQMDNYKALFFTLNHIDYYSAKNFNTNTLSGKLINLDFKIESSSLYEKLVVMIVLQKIYPNGTVESMESIAEKDRNKLTMCDIKTGFLESDSTYETTEDEVEPCALGGEQGMVFYIREMVQYPELSKELGEQGTAYVQYVVNADGSLTDFCILKSPSDLLSREALRVISLMPRWSPGYQKGKAVRVRYTVPINFRLT